MKGGTSRRGAVFGLFGAAVSVALSACGLRRSGTPPGGAGRPAVTGGTLGLGIVGLAVGDLDASLAFYRRLGLAIPADVDTSGGAFRLRLPSGMIFFWETLPYVRGFDPTYQPATGGDRKVILEFGFGTPEEVNAMYDVLLAAGARGYLAPVSWDNGAIRYAIVVDPDDNQIALRWPLVS
jgi:catechol 2,3-dioxygenase-like lactoylglutathione lyase family enzyme